MFFSMSCEFYGAVIDYSLKRLQEIFLSFVIEKLCEKGRKVDKQPTITIVFVHCKNLAWETIACASYLFEFAEYKQLSYFEGGMKQKYNWTINSFLETKKYARADAEQNKT